MPEPTEPTLPIPASAVIRRAPRPPKPKKKTGRPAKATTCKRCGETFKTSFECRTHDCPMPAKIGRPARQPAVDTPAEAPATQVAASEAPKPEAPPFAEPPHSKGYTRIYVDEHGAELAVPVTEETETRRQTKREPAPPAASVEVALPADVEMQKLCDEYGELDRRKQMRAADESRYETLKKAIKSWFDGAPSDADGTVEGELYLLHLSARERERKVRSMRELLEVIGIDMLLELATVALGALEDRIGKTRVQALTVEAQTGSRRIKAVAKHPAGLQ